MPENQYRHKNREAFREEIIEADGFSCAVCGRSRDEVVLQVHHKEYLRGKLPWDYPHNLCETLCSGCHAREHGIIRPGHGWDLSCEDDLGDLLGSCELCGTSIRYVFHINHKHWEPMVVGTVCCDALTGTTEASEHRKTLERQKRFIHSKRWQADPAGCCFLKQKKDLIIDILEDAEKYRIRMNGINGKKVFKTITAAKIFVFQSLETGAAQNFADRHTQCLTP